MPKRNIFIVDDDSGIRDSLKILLEAHGYDATDFASGAAFIDALPTLSLGCLIVDLQMPEMNGLELLDKLTAIGIKFPIVMITGHGDIATAVRAMQKGAADFVEKPFTDTGIIESINRALSGPAEPAEAIQMRESVAQRIRTLSRREREVMVGMVAGDPNKVIAYNLGLSTRTVEIHRARVMDKMQVRSLSALVRIAIAAGVDTPDWAANP